MNKKPQNNQPVTKLTILNSGQRASIKKPGFKIL